MKYAKPPLTISDQIKLLEGRGLIISDKIKAEKYLANISYYRLSAYLYPFKNLANDEYAKGTTFENVLDSYLFDRELRLLIFDAIERIAHRFSHTIDLSACDERRRVLVSGRGKF